MVDASSNTLQITNAAHAKIILHAMRHPHSPIHGILIGTHNTSSTSSTTISIDNVLPVCHSHPTKPILDMAFRIAEEVVRQQNNDDGGSIVGWYTCNERMTDNEPSSCSHRIIQSIANRYPEKDDPVMIVIDNVSLGHYLSGGSDDDDGTTTENPLSVYSKDARSKLWTRSGGECVGLVGGDEDRQRRLMGELLLDGGELRFFDFESHLDSSGVEEMKESSDWITNKAVVKFFG